MLSPVETDATLLANNSQHSLEMLRPFARSFSPSNARVNFNTTFIDPDLAKTAQRWYGMGTKWTSSKFFDVLQ